MPGLSEELLERTRSAREQCVRERVIERIWAKDPTLWHDSAAEEITASLGWLDAVTEAHALIEPLQAIATDVRERGLDRVVLCGMGGSSLAPEVICGQAGVDLLVLDSSHPDMVRAACQELRRTIVVVSSKSGSTLETESQLRQFVAAFEAQELPVSEHLVIVTDPDSKFDQFAQAQSIRVFHGNPEVGGRYSALTAFGLVPSAIAGADIGALLAQAEGILERLRSNDPANPALLLGTAMAAASAQGLGVLALQGPLQPGLGVWIEQLVAESLGKNQRGILPVVDRDGAAFIPTGALRVLFDRMESRDGFDGVILDEPLGAQFFLWEFATAIAGYLLDVNPFDQPDVESAKAAARKVLADFTPVERPDFIDGTIHGWGTTVDTLAAAISEFKMSIAELGYASICCFLDRWDLQGFEELADAASRTVHRPVTFGWGPRYLHSTGQLHKGGPLLGAFLHISEPTKPADQIPGQDFTWSDLISSQVRGDAGVLRELGLPVLRLELHDVARDLERIREALVSST